MIRPKDQIGTFPMVRNHSPYPTHKEAAGIALLLTQRDGAWYIVKELKLGVDGLPDATGYQVIQGTRCHCEYGRCDHVAGNCTREGSESTKVLALGTLCSHCHDEYPDHYKVSLA